MYDGPKVILGLVIFLILFTSPIWYNIADGTPEFAPQLAKPVKGDACVAPIAYMRTSHMELLNKWRDDVVRHDNRIYTAPDGTKYNKSLSLTCLDCHSNKEDFCDKCHNYAQVEPYCWDCHIIPKKEMK